MIITAQDEIGGVYNLETTVTNLNALSTHEGDIVIVETDAIILDDIDTTNGSINITADGQITATNVQASGVNQDVTLTTTAGGMILTGVLADDDVTATADVGDIAIDGVGAAGTVTITATTGSINEVAAGDAGADIMGDAVVLTAQDEIGGAAAFETEVTTISADSTLAGDIVFTELDIVGDGINLLSLDTNNGNITVVTEGGTVEAGTTTVVTDVRSDTGVAGAHDITITANSGDMTLGYLQSDDDVTLEATLGSITEINTYAVPGDAAVDIVGDLLTITAQDEIGSSTGELDIETTVANLNASSTTSGDIVITETDAIKLDDVDTANGAITIVAGGQITATAVDSTTDSDDNDISLTSTGSGIQAIHINAGTLGDVTLDAQGGAITQDAAVAVDVIADVFTASAAGGIDLDTTVNSVTATASAAGTIILDETDAITLTSVTTTDGSITVDSAGAMTVTLVTAGGDTGSNDDVFLTTTVGDIIQGGDITAANDTVTLTSAGDITDTTDNSSDISAADLIINAPAGSVGASGTNNQLDTNVDTITAAVKSDTYILEKDAVGLTSVVTTAGLVDVEAGGTITTTTVTANGGYAVNLNATAGDILDTAGGLITGTAKSSLRASGIVGTTINPVDVDIDGDLWVWAGLEQNGVSVILDGTVNSSAQTERVEIFEPSPPGLVILNNHLMGGGNYGSGSTGGSILSRGYGETMAVKAVLLSYISIIDDEFLNGPAVIIDGSQVGINIIPGGLFITPARFQPENYYIIRSR